MPVAQDRSHLGSLTDLPILFYPRSGFLVQVHPDRAAVSPGGQSHGGTKCRVETAPIESSSGSIFPSSINCIRVNTSREQQLF